LFFCNSPFCSGVVTDSYFKRNITWLNTDNDRCGFIKEAFDYNTFGYLAYAERVYNTPMIISVKNKIYSFQGEKTYKDFLKTHSLTKENLTNQFSMLFPIIRAKQHIEIRLSDGLKNKHKFFPVLFWKGLLYNKKTKNKLLEYTEDWTFDDINRLPFQILHSDYRIQYFKGIKFHNIIKVILENILDGLKKNESKIFSPFVNYILKHKMTIAETEINNYRNSGKNLLTFLTEDYESSSI